MEARIVKHGQGKKLVIDPCDEDEVLFLDDFNSVDTPLEAILTHELGREELHIEIKYPQKTRSK